VNGVQRKARKNKADKIERIDLRSFELFYLKDNTLIGISFRFTTYF